MTLLNLAPFGPDAGEQAQGKERHSAGVVLLNEGHEVLRLLSVECHCTATAATNSAGRNLRQRVIGNPIPLQREFEEG